MQCSRCGHQMDNPDARFCGRCGLPLHAEALALRDAPPDPMWSSPEELRAPPMGEPGRDDPPEPWTSARASVAFEFSVPGLDVLSRDVEVAAPLAAVPAPLAAAGSDGQNPAPLPPIPDLWPAAHPDASRTVRLDGCLIHLPGGVALIELELAADAHLNVAASALLWTSAARTDHLLLDDGGASGHPCRSEYLQLHGPGSAALTAGPAAMATPLDGAPDMALILAPDVLLAYTRRVRLQRWAAHVGTDLHVCAGSAEPVLLRCPAVTRILEIPAGEWLTVARNAVLARDASVGCVALERNSAAGSRQSARRLTGPGRVVLGFWPAQTGP